MEQLNFNQESLLKEIKSCFDTKELQAHAKSSKFIIRNTSRLTGESFLMMNVFDTTNGKQRSLEDSCDWLEEYFDVEMTKQSLDERYNTYAVDFMKKCFGRVLEVVNYGKQDRGMNLPFSKIQLTDATSFQIPDVLSTFYKGWKGQGGLAIIKMHLNYNFLNGVIEDIFLTDGSSNDNNYKLGEQSEITSNALYIRDLGYFDLKQFRRIDQQGAYFLSRSKTNCTYYIKDEAGQFQKINLADYLPSQGQIEDIEEIYVGHRREKTKVRLILQAVPEQVAQQRLKKLKRLSSKHPKTKISDQRKAMCYFNIFITNATTIQIPKEIARLIYTIRWQIELLFKIWKSIFDIDKVKKMSIFRFECYIYSKLIAILLTLHIHDRLGQYLWDEEEFELSPIKAARLIKKNGIR